MTATPHTRPESVDADGYHYTCPRCGVPFTWPRLRKIPHCWDCTDDARREKNRDRARRQREARTGAR